MAGIEYLYKPRSHIGVYDNYNYHSYWRITGNMGQCYGSFQTQGPFTLIQTSNSSALIVTTLAKRTINLWKQPSRQVLQYCKTLAFDVADLMVP